MHPIPRSGSYVCLPCLLRDGRRTAARSIRNQNLSQTDFAGARRLRFYTNSQSLSIRASPAVSSSDDSHSTGHINVRRVRAKPGRNTVHNTTNEATHKAYATHTGPDEPPVGLVKEQTQHAQTVYNLRRRLQDGLNEIPDIYRDNSTADKTWDTVELLRQLTSNFGSKKERTAQTTREAYISNMYSEFKEDRSKAVSHGAVEQRTTKDQGTKKGPEKLRSVSQNFEVKSESESGATSGLAGNDTRPLIVNPFTQPGTSSRSLSSQRKSLLKSIATATQLKEEKSVEDSEGKADATAARSTTQRTPGTSFPTKKTGIKAVNSSELKLEPISEGKRVEVPRLSFDLSRVLFNPGVYHLRDPRSRVYNFDPYLEQPMPISEFNFDALNEYITSSDDKTLLHLAAKLRKRYVGSSSSMSSVMCQFHFLLSQWRPLNIGNLSKSFDDSRRDFTIISKSPAAVFLRYRDGVYAVDADKEFDEPNVLMSYGKSLEKLLTLEKNDFEKWRRKNNDADREFSDSQGEAFHYSSQGSFLLRSQLDAYDSRLPGSGIFDLKTRAVAGIRMNIRAHEEGMGYQIKERFGTWESYEREYYDMMRSTFLKYSMQVRMGNMDGIFVAYHNIENIFGFQYIPLSEMDSVLHGQADPCLGDREFRLSINFMNEIFDQVTKAYPEQSIRFYFETREPSASEPKPYMHIFAEPMSDEEVTQIQKRASEDMIAFEKRIFGGDNQEDALESSALTTDPEEENQSSVEDGRQNEATTSGSLASNAANTAFLDEIIGSVPVDAKPVGPKPLMAFKLMIQNQINDSPITRPEGISSQARWSVDYTLEQLGAESSRRLYTFCKNRRMAALSVGRRTKSQFIQNIRDMSQRGAVWRKEQDRLDSQRETVVLYTDQATK